MTVSDDQVAVVVVKEVSQDNKQVPHRRGSSSARPSLSQERPPAPMKLSKESSELGSNQGPLTRLDTLAKRVNLASTVEMDDQYLSDILEVKDTDYSDILKESNSTVVSGAFATLPGLSIKSNSDDEPKDSHERIEIAAYIVKEAITNRNHYHRNDLWVHRLLHTLNGRLYRFALFFVIILNLSLTIFERPAIVTIPHGISQGVEVLTMLLLGIDLALKFPTLTWTNRRKNLRINIWPILQGVIIVLTVLDVLINLIFPNSIRLTRVLRCFFIVEFSPMLRNNFMHILRSAFRMVEVIVIIIYLVVLFAIVGFTLWSGNASDPSFKTFFDAFLNLFVCLTTANFPDIMLPAYRLNPLNSIFFIIFLSLGIYVVLNRSIAIVYAYYKEAMKQEAVEEYISKRKALVTVFRLLDIDKSGSVEMPEWLALFKLVRPRGDIEDAKLLFKELDTDNSKSVEMKEFFKLCDVLLFYTVKEGPFDVLQRLFPRVFAAICISHFSVLKRIIYSSVYEILLSVLIFVNAIMIVIDLNVSYSPIWETIFLVLDSLLLLVFVIEIFFKMFGLGLKEFWTSRWNIFDFLVIFIAVSTKIIVDVVLVYTSIGLHLDTSASQFFHSLQAVAQVLRVLRFLRLLSISHRIRAIVDTYITLIIPLTYFSCTLLVVMFVFGVIGQELFAGKLNPLNPDLKGTDYDVLNYYNIICFDDIGRTFVTLFHLLIVNNWHVTTKGVIAVTSKWAVLYFLLYYLSCVVVLLNLAMAVFLDIFQFQL